MAARASARSTPRASPGTPRRAGARRRVSLERIARSPERRVGGVAGIGRRGARDGGGAPDGARLRRRRRRQSAVVRRRRPPAADPKAKRPPLTIPRVVPCLASIRARSSRSARNRTTWTAARTARLRRWRARTDPFASRRSARRAEASRWRREARGTEAARKATKRLDGSVYRRGRLRGRMRDRRRARGRDSGRSRAAMMVSSRRPRAVTKVLARRGAAGFVAGPHVVCWRHRGAVTAIACHPRVPDIVVTCDSNREVVVWDTSLVVMDKMVFHKARVAAAAWSPDGNALATGSLGQLPSSGPSTSPPRLGRTSRRPRTKARARTPGVTALAWRDRETLATGVRRVVRTWRVVA